MQDMAMGDVEDVGTKEPRVQGLHFVQHGCVLEIVCNEV